jgi:hypothetical protein
MPKSRTRAMWTKAAESVFGAPAKLARRGEGGIDRSDLDWRGLTPGQYVDPPTEETSAALDAALDKLGGTAPEEAQHSTSARVITDAANDETPSEYREQSKAAYKAALDAEHYAITNDFTAAIREHTIAAHLHNLIHKSTGSTSHRQAATVHAATVLILKGRPVKLARVRYNGQASGVSEKLSSNHEARVSLAKRILSETGLMPATVRSVLSHTDERGVRPGVLAAIHKPVPDDLLHYAASWLGMMTGEKRLTTFKPGTGSDSLHIITSPAKSQDVGEYLRRLGAHFSLDSSGAGTRALLVNPTINTNAAARGLSGTVKTLDGTATRLGSGDDSDARARYRHTISKAEQSAGVSPGPTGVI